MGAGSWESHHAISTLIFRYAECVDQADFDGLAELFAAGTLRSIPGEDSERGLRGEELARFYAATNRIHEDGTLRTRHLTTNLQIEIDEDEDTATARSTFVVLQATPKLPFQPIVGGRYEDRFERVDGRWRFSARLIRVDQIGDMSEHLSFDLGQGSVRFEDLVGER
jgi:3-phenylpropionate/cinnamic acid dioxygenase small subunit